MKAKKLAPPDNVSDEIKQAWNTFASQIGDVQPTDLSALLVLATAWTQMETAQRHIDTMGAAIELKNGYLNPNPYCKDRDKARTVVMKLMAEFGLTPGSRTKINGKQDDELDDDF